MTYSADKLLLEREKQLRASRGPTFTFMCAGAHPASITGRKRINKRWWCAACAGGAV